MIATTSPPNIHAELRSICEKFGIDINKTYSICVTPMQIEFSVNFNPPRLNETQDAVIRDNYLFSADTMKPVES